MLPEIFFTTFIPLLLLVALAVFLGVAYLVSSRRSSKNKGATPMSKAEETAYEIIHEASQNAEDLVTDAELESIRMTARERLQSKELLTSYEHKLNLLLNELTNHLSHRGQEAQEEMEKFSQHLEDLAEEKVEATGSHVETQLENYFEDARGLMKNFTTDLREQTSTTLETELAQVRTEIADYKAHQLEALDTRIVDVVRQVLEGVTAQSLSLEEHANLIRTALQKAKSEHA